MSSAPPTRRPRTCAALVAAAVALGVTVPLLASPVAAQDATPPFVVVEALSTRADLVTGGDVLLAVDVPAGAQGLRVDVAGRDVTAAFRPSEGRLVGLVQGLPEGVSTVTATVADGRGARLQVTNHSLTGPVFSGPQISPWTCADGARDTGDGCASEPVVELLYRSTAPAPAGLQPYDPESPPTDVAESASGVPFVVRVETGTALRDEYRIAGLVDPAAPLDPAGPQAVNGRLVLTHGQSCDTEYQAAGAPDVLLEDALSRGFVVASHALDNAGHSCNLVTQAESLVVTKELAAERFGAFDWTIGSGCSGGSLVQAQVANAYPGVYQGITPQCSFTDAWSSAQQYIDYVGLRTYLEGPDNLAAGLGAITPVVQWPGILGHANPANAVTFTTAIPNSGDPSRPCVGVEDDELFSADNQDGVRCTLQDYAVNVFGEDETGRALRPISNVGVQYGLSGLLSTLRGEPVTLGGSSVPVPPLTPAQFVALNEGVGGFDIDFEPTAERTVADPVAQERVYRSGGVNTGAHLDDVAILDLGGPEPGAFHDVYRKYAMRDRLLREHGTADNQVFWEGQVPLLGDLSFVDDSIVAMDRWLAVVDADERDVPLAQKIIDAKDEAGIAERCVAADGADAPLELCDTTVDATIFSSPRIEAAGGAAELTSTGEPVGFSDDRLDCQTVPLEQADYAGQDFAEVFTEAEQATLRTVFPTGVCDDSRPGNGFRAAETWLTYADVVGGVPLGAAPVSVPFGPQAAGPGVVVGGPAAAPAPGAAGPTGTGGAGTGAGGPGRTATGALAATGAPALLPLAALSLLGLALLSRRRRTG